ncbi:hypothetical protein CYMTET_35583 [Cymbomonas tetramitiformis]|uniref:Uncharacterized protein n=1 Tax=Cymbomonas tetramitiformis TaxID=36881 RepID=A0AAE0F8Z7_9CHLO|nr:hypothetical protein CYMTET_35583 [Cymbomonas tetramitiformis]
MNEQEALPDGGADPEVCRDDGLTPRTRSTRPDEAGMPAYDIFFATAFSPGKFHRIGLWPAVWRSGPWTVDWHRTCS